MGVITGALLRIFGSAIGAFCGVLVYDKLQDIGKVDTLGIKNLHKNININTNVNEEYPSSENITSLKSEDELEERITNFKKYLGNRELSSNTIQAYCTSMRQFFQIYNEVSKENGIEWKNKLQAAGYSPRTVNVRINAFNTYCKMLEDPSCKLKVVRVHGATAVDNVISKDNYNKLLDGLASDENWRWFFGIKLLAMTGSRVSEFSRLKKSDLGRGYAEMWTKGKIRRIYIPKSFIDESQWYYKDFKDDDYLFPGRNGAQITRRGVSVMLQKLAVKYGIEEKVMHPHSFRHLFALEFLQRDSNLTLLADVMGHSSVSTTAIYTRMSQEQQTAIINNVVNW